MRESCMETTNLVFNPVFFEKVIMKKLEIKFNGSDRADCEKRFASYDTPADANADQSLTVQE